MRKMNDARYLRLGCQVGRQLGYHASLTAVERRFGFKGRQNAWYYTNVLLGRVIFQVREKIKEATDRV